MPEVLSFEHFPAEISSPDITNAESNGSSSPVTEDRHHAIAVAVATAAAAEAAVAAAQAAAKVVRLSGYGRQTEEDRAATFIQSHYRGYLVTSSSLFLDQMKWQTCINWVLGSHKIPITTCFPLHLVK